MPELRTFLAQMINPEVMAAMISAELPKKLRARDYMRVDTTLTGRAGDTITIPRFKYIGEAVDLAEGAEGVPVKLETEDVSYTVKKAAQFVSLTDEAVLSGYGDPVGEVAKQLRMSIEDKIDSDALMELNALPDTRTIPGKIDFETICRAVDLFDHEEPGESLTILVSSEGLIELRKEPRFNDSSISADRLTETGTVGIIAGCKVVKWRKLAPDTAYIVKKDALTIFVKRNCMLEDQRNILTKVTTFSADQHFLVAIEDEEKIVRIRRGK